MPQHSPSPQPMTGLTRRQFIRLTVLGGATLALLPACEEAPGPRFFSDAERAAVAVLADYVLPPDDTPGAAELGAPRYIETLLTAFEHDPPRLFAAGPYSNRNPLPRPDGLPSEISPDNNFLQFMPLTREQEMTWRLLLYGSKGIPGGAPNDGLFGPTVGLRQLFTDNLRIVLDSVDGVVERLDLGATDDAWRRLSPEFRQAFTRLVVESVVGPPEYGGNINRKGWRMIHFLGDSAPLGYTPFDEVAGAYRVRGGEPFAERDVRPDPDPIDEEVEERLAIIVAFAGGRRFS